ncbi:dimethylaniline monooxygenase [Bimuria novae-zelandiae CBS 107.79]|uniref:Dimethylaniline monooxygenase n=1 Tax=Bimuria novae-zelandiae CBS 107.79 TaxID=1447943 RepID=A0A6A5UUQ6_9PLEO|nr:dimethylaniline monooxygenase [Bimuria novae-zelandiae CBS 107.79]
MAPRYSSVAVIGAGPSGISAIKALSEENIFDRVHLFERRERAGGTWLYDEDPEPFSPSPTQPEYQPPVQLPASTLPLPEHLTSRTGIYPALVSNVGAEVMSFTYKPFPVDNSAVSVHRYGPFNPTRPWQTIAKYIEEVAEPFTHLISLYTHVERMRKVGAKWVITLRKTDHKFKGEQRDFWWQESFDAVIVATGHYSVAHVPNISGLPATWRALPDAFEHSKAYRLPDRYVSKKVVVVGGNLSASDTVSELYDIVSGPLYVSQRGHNNEMDGAWNLPNVLIKPQISHISASLTSGVKVRFADGSEVDNVDKVHFATGYQLSYPFLDPNPVTPSGRMAAFYQHIFNIADPSLAVVGQVKSAISLRVYEYQAVAVARCFAGRGGGLPSSKEQDEWEVNRLQYKGPTASFHEIKPDYGEYFESLRKIAGKEGGELPEWQDDWALKGFAVFQLKAEWWKRLKEEERKNRISAKL